LLLEAGPGGHPLSRVPISYGKLIQDPAANWCYESEPEESMAGRRIPVPRGRVLGGSSAINGLVYVRGQPRDYDIWAQLGNRGWAWNDLFPIFGGWKTMRVVMMRFALKAGHYMSVNALIKAPFMTP
jgi:choline dehydrogenase